MNKTIALFFGLLLSIGLTAQDDVLLNIAGENITLEEFLMVYNKNNSNAQSIDPKTKEEYLDLYVNFRLKVRQAEDMGMDTNKNFSKELSGYRRQLAVPYLNDETVTEELIQEAYDRMQQDVNAYHILIRCEADASPQDSLVAWRKCMLIKREITDPLADFEKLARVESQDPSAVENGGNLGYFNVFQMVYPFESAAYNTPVGEVSDPVRSRFGYHLVWVKDRRPARGEIRVAHIMVQTSEDDDEVSAQEKEKKAIEIYDELQAGANFEELARKYSDDRGTANKGGELPWFGTGRMVPVFEEAAFGLEKDGDISAPVKSNFGWHIVKRLEKKGIPAKEELNEELKKKVSRDGRARKSKDSFYARIKKEYKFKANTKAVDAMAAYIDEWYYNAKWKAEEKYTSESPVWIMKLTDKKYIKETRTYTQADFASYMEKNKTYQRKPAVDSLTVVSNLFKEFYQQKLTEFEDQRLEAKYVEFNALMKEYHDGILLFDLMDQKVWSKAVKDSAGLADFYEAHKSEHQWPKRLDATLFVCSDKAIAEATLQMAQSQVDSGLDTRKIMEEINRESQLNLQVQEGKYTREDHPWMTQIEWKQGFSEIIDADGKMGFVYVSKVLDAGPKELNEVRGLVISAYQDELEKKWIEELKAKYAVTVNKELLN